MLAAYRSVRTDCVSKRLAAEFDATLDGMAALGGNIAGIHWCLSPDTFVPDKLGRDGHPRPGDCTSRTHLTAPHVGGWSAIVFLPLKAGDAATRISSVQDITHKEGPTV